LSTGFFLPIEASPAESIFAEPEALLRASDPQFVRAIATVPPIGGPVSQRRRLPQLARSRV